MNCSAQRGLSPRMVFRLGWLPNSGPNRLPTIAILSQGSPDDHPAGTGFAARRPVDFEAAPTRLEGMEFIDQQIRRHLRVGVDVLVDPVMPLKMRREPRR